MPAPPLSTAAVGMLEGELATKEGCLGDSQVSIRQGNEGEVRTRALCLPAGGWQCERKRAHKAVLGQEHVRRPTRQASIWCGGPCDTAVGPGGPSEVKVPKGIPVSSSDGVTMAWPRDA